MSVWLVSRAVTKYVFPCLKCFPAWAVNVLIGYELSIVLAYKCVSRAALDEATKYFALGIVEVIGMFERGWEPICDGVTSGVGCCFPFLHPRVLHLLLRTP